MNENHGSFQKLTKAYPPVVGNELEASGDFHGSFQKLTQGCPPTIGKAPLLRLTYYPPENVNAEQLAKALTALVSSLTDADKLMGGEGLQTLNQVSVDGVVIVDLGPLNAEGAEDRIDRLVETIEAEQPGENGKVVAKKVA